MFDQTYHDAKLYTSTQNHFSMKPLLTTLTILLSQLCHAQDLIVNSSSAIVHKSHLRSILLKNGAELTSPWTYNTLQVKIASPLRIYEDKIYVVLAGGRMQSSIQKPSSALSVIMANMGLGYVNTFNLLSKEDLSIGASLLCSAQLLKVSNSPITIPGISSLAGLRSLAFAPALQTDFTLRLLNTKYGALGVSCSPWYVIPIGTYQQVRLESKRLRAETLALGLGIYYSWTKKKYK